MSENRNDFPRSFGLRKARSIVNASTVLLAQMLPHCSARQISVKYWPTSDIVELSFVDQGPVVPLLNLKAEKHFTYVYPEIVYSNMFLDIRENAISFHGKSWIDAIPLELGAERIAREVAVLVTEQDIDQTIAKSTPQYYLEACKPTSNPWSWFETAVYAIYLGLDQKGHNALEEAMRLARKDGRWIYRDLILTAKDYLAKLEKDAEALRQELNTVMEGNWSRFRIVES